MAVWETIAVASIPAAFTAASLIYQQRRADRREAANADRELAALESARKDAAMIRAEERALEEEAHRRQLASEWRAERQAVHTRLLTLMDTAYERNMAPLFQDIRYKKDKDSTVLTEVLGDRGDDVLGDAMRAEIKNAASAVELLASQAAADAGGTAARLLLSMDLSFSIGEFMSVDEVLTEEKQYKHFRQVYQKAARQDLGTAD